MGFNTVLMVLNDTVDHSADGNLEAVIIDLEARGADKVCIGTLNTILMQITSARAALLG